MWAWPHDPALPGLTSVDAMLRALGRHGAVRVRSYRPGRRAVLRDHTSGPGARGDRDRSRGLTGCLHGDREQLGPRRRARAPDEQDAGQHDADHRDDGAGHDHGKSHAGDDADPG
jgi:hypothetical protein